MNGNVFRVMAVIHQPEPSADDPSQAIRPPGSARDKRNPQLSKGKDIAMLSWAITFLVVALIAGLMGFGLVGGMAYSAAKICFFVFLVLFVISLLAGRRAPTV
jgi:uncharacterized membrane protein YtjA (UPF0391 family)